ncbi:MAG: malto-oligosyltrehalose synthase [Mycobacteriales bacterium]|nr:malto-oligosyltrehalose synthase [Mycobacteriales bacterium]
MPHLPAAGRPVPVSTYRVQLTPSFGFADAAAVVPYLAELGVTHLYCSPYLQSAPGSQHGYDVVDHDRLDSDLGGPVDYLRLVEACAEAGLGVVLDIVPNHMAVSEPEQQNAAWTSVLRDGPSSAYASWFDVDWASPDNPGKVLVPVLGKPLELSLDELVVTPESVTYYEHVLPVAPGTFVEGDPLATLQAQHYRLAHWRDAADSLDYRRFFDVTTLAGLRVEVPEVFDATHALVLQQLRDGVVDGLRVDHPDGLADPEGYLRRLAEASGGSWVVVEKILEPGEELPSTWDTAGTTGYDALNRLLGLFVDPLGEQRLTALWRERDPLPYDEVVEQSKRLVLSEVLRPEVHRLVRLAQDATGLPTERLEPPLVELLVAFGVYRAYLPPDGPADEAARGHVDHAVALARSRRPDLADDLHLWRGLVLGEGGAPELVTRFQQTCGPVMAKGVEDTAFYRYLRLTALCEVGGDPGTFGVLPADFHRACVEQADDWPLSMTTLSTHDTKRSEDVRARLVLLSEMPDEWGAVAARWDARHPDLDAPTRYLVWQTLVGAWPLAPERLGAYLEKATREAKASTSWVDPAPAYDESLQRVARAVLADRDLVAEVEDLVARLDGPWRTTSLAQKLVQLTMPGVADTYQGTELADLSLVDPDNRRPVDFDERRRQLADLGSADPKLRLLATSLRLRRDRPETFLRGSYTPLPAGLRALAFCRGEEVVTVVPVRAVSVARDGWGDEAVELPPGRWHDLLTDAEHDGGSVRLADLLTDSPVALLVRA